jgi:glutamine cyclotransferase
MHKLQLHHTSRATNSVPRIAAFALLALCFACVAHARDAATARFLRYDIVATHPHDTRAFTQGLAIVDGRILESTGQLGRSALWLKDVATGRVAQRASLAADQFGEGVASDGARLVQLTWQSGVALIYDFALKRVGQWRYDGEGWGLAFDGTQWLMSDGSEHITRRDRATFAPLGRIRVTDAGRPVRALNELEFAGGRLYANVWHRDVIAVIAPETGRVESWIDLAPLRRGFRPPEGWDPAEHVPNGIAHDPATGHLFVTGKCWPVLFEIRLEDRAP